MTVIAWDGTTLAADRRACGGGFLFSTTKIHRLEGGTLVGVCGAGDKHGEFIAWLATGRDPKQYPKNEGDATFTALVIETDGRIHQFERTAYPMRVENERHAIGSGRDFALAAMHLGRSAVEAVELACCLDEACGNGVDVLLLGGDAFEATVTFSTRLFAGSG